MKVAVYARYSGENQREASLEDQMRNCRNYCVREGWPAPIEYTDRAISGSRLDRTSYRRLLSQASHFDVILVDDLTRLGRDKEEIGRVVKRLVFGGVRLIGVSDGVDTTRKSHKVDVGMRGLMSELFLDDLADKTHRGQMGRALAGASAGGLPYGYTVTSLGDRAIDEDQAKVVRRIFAEYIAGKSARDIASGLNRDGVPAPRGGSWAMSAIHGDLKRGIGILVNPLYAGRQVWNRSHWIKHPDTGRRVRKERPPSEWVTSEKPELAIVPPYDWDQVQAALKQRSQTHKGRARSVKHLLSGILRCGVCQGPMVAVDRYRYGCATRKDRGTTVCPSTVTFPRREAEEVVLTGIKQQLLTQAAFDEFQRHVTALLKEAAPDTSSLQRQIDKAQRERDNILGAIRAGIYTASVKQDLEKAEAEVEQLQRMMSEANAFQPSQVLPRARDIWNRVARTLQARNSTNDQIRKAIIDLVGERIVVNEKGADFIAEIDASSHCQIDVVEGARSVLHLTEPVRWTLPRKGRNHTRSTGRAQTLARGPVYLTR